MGAVILPYKSSTAGVRQMAAASAKSGAACLCAKAASWVKPAKNKASVTSHHVVRASLTKPISTNIPSIISSTPVV